MNASLAAPISTVSTPSRQTDWLPVAALGLLWLEVVARLHFEWNVNPQYGYGWTVPFLAAFIFWQRSENAPAPSRPASTRLPAIAMVSAAVLFFPVRLIQEANPDWRILSWTMALSAIVISLGGIYLAGGTRWLRHFAFPFLFFLVAVPWPMRFEQFVIQGLMRSVTLMNVEVLNAIGISAVQMGNVIEIGSGFVGIDEACTGVRSLQSTFMISLFLGEFYGFNAVRRIILVLAGACLAFVCNLIRTFLLVWLGAEQGANAIKAWHDPAGLTILMACLFALWGVSALMRGKRRASAVPTLSENHRAFRFSRGLLGYLFALILAAELGTQAWYGIHEARATRVEPWNVAWPNEAHGWQAVPVAERAQELLRYNEGGGGSWTGEDGRQWTMYFFKWLPGRTAGLFIKNHRPDICLPASGMTLRGGAQNKLFAINGVNLPIRSYVFENGSALLHVYYCYWDGTPAEGAPHDQENWTASGRIEAVRRGKRDVGTQMLEIVAAGYDNDSAAEEAVRAQLSKIVRRN